VRTIEGILPVSVRIHGMEKSFPALLSLVRFAAFKEAPAISLK
jgi:hypothetical protein